MKKKIIDDVITTKRRSVREIPKFFKEEGRNFEPIRDESVRRVSEEEISRKADEATTNAGSHHEPLRTPSLHYGNTNFALEKESIFNGKWIAGIVGALVLIFVLLSTVFVHATVNVTPRTELLPITIQATAFKDPDFSNLSFTTLTISTEQFQKLKATKKESVVTKASGEIVISNTSPDLKKLVKNTRFETPDGLIYRIQDPVSIPGAKTVNSKEVPGQITALVVADQAGDKYNINSGINLTVPGLKGDPLFEKITAKTSTAIAGGANGIRPVPSETDKNKAIATMDEEMQKKLLAEIATQIPEDSVLFDKTISFSYQNLPEKVVDQENVELGRKAVLVVPVFKKDVFASYIARSIVPNFTNEPVKITNLNDLVVTILENSNSRAIADAETLSISIEGKPQLVWLFDEIKLKNDLAGIPKKQVDAVLSSYTGIEEAKVSIRPFWKTKLPKESNISVEIQENDK